MSITPPAPGAAGGPAAQIAADATQTRRTIRRALVSVHDKTGLAPLAAALHVSGVEIVSTGGSAAMIAGLGIPVTSVEQLTGFPECLEGRVKTLHPRVHAGILADTRKTDHLRQLDDLGVQPFELVVVNLYPFAATVASGASTGESVEQIDIGGPAMARAAAKNHASVAVVTSPTAYELVVRALTSGGFTLAERQRLAAAAFAHTASYDVQVATWMSALPTPPVSGTAHAPGAPEHPGTPEPADAFPTWLGATWVRGESLRYGENPHQRAALYRAELTTPGLAQAPLLHGKAMSFNNYVDADAALRAAHDHGEVPTVAIIKHANPCGVAIGADVAQAHARAHACDPVSAFGGIVATNRPVTAAMAAQVAEVFTEVVLAPDFEPEALTILTAKKNLRLLQVGAPPRGRPGVPDDGVGSVMDSAETRPVSGGLLVQDRDGIDAPGDHPAAWQLAAGRPADEATLHDLAFAWRAVRAVKSNAILLAREAASVGIGMGQVNRVDACQLAVRRAGRERAEGSVAASDAFFPFADGLQVLIDAGVRAVVSPGGSVRDEEVRAAADAAGVTLYFTGTRHFAH